jgi:hypothetical protein
MSLFNWLFPASKAHKAPPAAESSGLSRMEATRPAGRREKDSHPQPNGQPANRKGERMARRELLYTVVRESMTRAGVLSASYKFKVLSLDARGRQFLVMVDLARESGGETASLAEIEALIAQAAKSRYDIIVTSVYWRMNEHVATGATGNRSQRGTPSQPMPLESHPGGLDSLPASFDSGPVPLTSQPAPLSSRPTPLAAKPEAAQSMVAAAPQRPAAQRTPARFEPIDADEVAAFKQALAAGVAKPAGALPKITPTVPVPTPSQKEKGEAALAAAAAAGGASAKAFDGSSKHGPQSYTLLTGFEDTEMPEQDARSPAALSGTQYGELR